MDHGLWPWTIVYGHRPWPMAIEHGLWPWTAALQGVRGRHAPALQGAWVRHAPSIAGGFGGCKHPNRKLILALMTVRFAMGIGTQNKRETAISQSLELNSALKVSTRVFLIHFQE